MVYCRLERAGIPIPKCIVLKKNVLVMSFIGENQIPAPKLKDARLSYADMQIAYELCIEVSCRILKALQIQNMK